MQLFPGSVAFRVSDMIPLNDGVMKSLLQHYGRLGHGQAWWWRGSHRDMSQGHSGRDHGYGLVGRGTWAWLLWLLHVVRAQTIDVRLALLLHVLDSILDPVPSSMSSTKVIIVAGGVWSVVEVSLGDIRCWRMERLHEGHLPRR